MANHCIDATCADCGREWCALGCGYSSPLNECRANAVQASVQAGKAIYANERCQCSSRNVYVGSYYAKEEPKNDAE